jgi:hypothetical protein
VVPALQASFDFCKVSTPSSAWLFPDGSSSLGFWVNFRPKSSAEYVIVFTKRCTTKDWRI